MLRSRALESWSLAQPLISANPNDSHLFASLQFCIGARLSLVAVDHANQVGARSSNQPIYPQNVVLILNQIFA